MRNANKKVSSRTVLPTSPGTLEEYDVETRNAVAVETMIESLNGTARDCLNEIYEIRHIARDSADRLLGDYANSAMTGSGTDNPSPPGTAYQLQTTLAYILEALSDLRYEVSRFKTL